MKYRSIYLVVVSSAIVFYSCRTTKGSTFGYEKTEAVDTITSLDQPASSKIVVFKAPNNKQYYAKTVIAGPPEEIVMSTPSPASTTSAIEEQFRDGQPGGVRQEAKTTFATGAYKVITLKNLFSSLPTIDSMDHYGLGPDSIRVLPEKRNVHIKTAYLYIVKHEDDNDYHFIFGEKANYQQAKYIMNGEISGLPGNFFKDSAQLRKVRKKAVEFFTSIKHCNTTNYILSIPIEIKGSLFFDYHHRNNTAKCKDVQSKTAWEIHPVYDIKFK